MDTKKIDSRIDDVADDAEKTAGKAEDRGGETDRKGTDGLHAVEARGGGAAKVAGDRVEEAAEKVGHRIQEAGAKAAYVGHAITRKVVHEVQEAATKVEHRGQELVDKAARKLRGH